jgi:hypothetical protein
VRIGLLSDAELVNSVYRSYEPLEAVVRRGRHELIHNSRDRALSLEQLLRCDVVHIHRDWSPNTVTAVQRLHEAGVGIVWDNDDDILALPRWNPHYRRYGPAGRREIATGVRTMVRLADVVTTPSAVLAEQYREHGAHEVRVLENYLPAVFMRAPRHKHEGVAIATLASLEHQVDYERLRIGEVLRALLDAHPDLTVINVGLGLGLPADRCRHVKGAPFEDLVDIVSHADIGIAPLADIPWNRARSNIKLKEYTAGGLAWLASPVGPYLGMGEQQGGRLVADDGWHAAIEQLVVDARARRKLAKRGAKWVKGQGVEAHAADWERVLRDAAERAQARTGAATRRSA